MYYTEGFPKSDLRQFIANDDCVDNNPVYESQQCWPQIWSWLVRRFRQDYQPIEEEDEAQEEQQPILAWVGF